MFEKEAKERARDFTDNEGRQVAYEYGFLDGADRATEELKEKLNYAKEIIKDLLDNSDEYAKQRAIDFLKEE